VKHIHGEYEADLRTWLVMKVGWVERSRKMMTKMGLLDQLNTTAKAWDELAAEALQADPTRSGAMGDWSFVDVAGHLNGWRVRSVARLEAAASGAEPPPPPWPDGLSTETDEGVDAINRWIYEQYHDRPLAEILSEAQDQWRRMQAAAEAIPEPDLLTPGRYPWRGGYPPSEVITGAAAHFHEEHEADIRHWLSSQRG
jgi:hypothetical protein